MSLYLTKGVGIVLAFVLPEDHEGEVDIPLQVWLQIPVSQKAPPREVKSSRVLHWGL
jgi:hypothetical protein